MQTEIQDITFPLFKNTSMESIKHPRRMVAAILEQQRAPLVIDEVELPERLTCGQVLVRVLYSGICGSQLGEIDGVKGEDRYLPHLLGHEGVGEVLQVGEGVRFVHPGQRVVLHWRKGAGMEAVPATYKWRNKQLNAGWVTTFNQYTIVSENRLTPVDDDVDTEILPLLGCAVTTGFGVVTNNAKVSIGDSVVVFGAGGVGLNVIQGAVLAGAYPIVAIDLYDNRLELAARLGATHCINGSSQDVMQTIQDIVGKSGADVCIDNTGNTKVISMAYSLTAPQGRTVLVGVPHKNDDASIHTLPLHFGKTLTGSHGGESRPELDIPRYVKLLRAGKLQLRECITEVFALEEINTAIERMRSGELAGRCLINCHPDLG
ncbi:zinc-binding dehydrogenase [Oceanidesulfovibrio marinus]|nr:zinc-binding dehydrogenase [Oceanidesulfovibrio marinus]